LQVLVISGISFRLMRNTQKREKLDKLEGGVKIGNLTRSLAFFSNVEEWNEVKHNHKRYAKEA
jgi:hypothetical protein